MDVPAESADAYSQTPDRLFDVEAVIEQLGRLLSSATFASAPQARALLSFVVTETVAGRGEQLNERVITRLALGRPAPVDTRVDASGRVQASRARERLDRYYAGEGRDDPIVIAIPRGQYAAVFTRRTPSNRSSDRIAAVPRTGTIGPVIAVTNLAHGGTSRERRVAFGLVEMLIETLSSFPGIRVVGPINLARQQVSDTDIAGIAERTDASYVLHGRVQEVGATLRVSMRLVDAASGQVRWSESFDRDADPDGDFRAQDDIAASVAATVGDFNGVVLRDELRAANRDGNPRVAEALRRYYSFLADLGPDSEAEVVEALNEAHLLEPANATVMGCLAAVHAVAVLMRGPELASDSMRQAEHLAQQVLALDPASAPAHNVLAIVMLARGRLVEAEQHARRTLQLTPFHPNNIYAAGMVIGACGHWDAGIDVIRRAVQLNPYGPSHHRTLLAVDALLRNDVAEALAQASLVRFPGYLYGPLLRLICLDELGLAAEAERERAEVVALVPDFFDHPAAVLSVAPTLPRHVVDHLVERIDRRPTSEQGTGQDLWIVE